MGYSDYPKRPILIIVVCKLNALIECHKDELRPLILLPSTAINFWKTVFQGRQLFRCNLVFFNAPITFLLHRTRGLSSTPINNWAVITTIRHNTDFTEATRERRFRIYNFFHWSRFRFRDRHAEKYFHLTPL